MTAPRTLIDAHDGTRLAVHAMDGDDRCVVALHGFTGSLDDMVPLVEAVRGERSAFLIDVVGHGSSEAPAALEPYRMSSVVDHVLGAVGPRPPGTVHLIGYSMGGRIALSAAARAPWYFASVTTLSAMAGLDDPVERADRHAADEHRAQHLEQIGVGAFLDEWFALPLFEPFMAMLTADARASLHRRRSEASVTGLANSLRGTGTGSMPPVWDRLALLRTPLLAIAGTLDQRYVDFAQRLAEAAPGARSETVAAGHVVHAENLEAVTALVAPFLEGCDERPSYAPT